MSRSKWQGFRPFIFPAVLFLFIAVPTMVLMAKDQLGNEGFVAVALLTLYMIYSVFEFQAINSVSQEELDHPLIGKSAEVTEQFSAIAGGFEGRVVVNGAPWNARSETHRFEVGDKAVVDSLIGHTLQLKSCIKSNLSD